MRSAKTTANPVRNESRNSKRRAGLIVGLCMILMVLVIAMICVWQIWGLEAYNKALYKSRTPYLVTPFWDINAVGFYFENEHYAGLARDDEGRVLTDNRQSDFIRGGTSTNGGTTRLGAQYGLVQTWIKTVEDTYVPAAFEPVITAGAIKRLKVASKNHCQYDLDLLYDISNLNICPMIPTHVQYLVTVHGVSIVEDPPAACGTV